MIVTPTEHGLEGFVGKSILPRSTDTLHLSEIYGDLFARLEPDRYGRPGGPDPLKLEAGLSFESILEEGLKQRLGQYAERPGELVSEEGIHCSPDLILFNGHPRVGEIKLTWMSCREMPVEKASNLPYKFDKWVVQMKGYCHLIGTPFARLIGFFINGDYRPTQPKLLAWDLEFSARELKENWDMLVTHARTMGRL